MSAFSAATSAGAGDRPRAQRGAQRRRGRRGDAGARLRRLRRRRRLDRRDRRPRPRGRRHRAQRAAQPRRRRRAALRLPLGAGQRLRRRSCRSTPTASTTRTRSPSLLGAMRDDERRHGRRLALRRGRRAPTKCTRPAASRWACWRGGPSAPPAREVIDSTSGFRAIRRPLLDQFAADYPVEYLGDTVEALIEAGRAGRQDRRAPDQRLAARPRQRQRRTCWRASGTSRAC